MGGSTLPLAPDAFSGRMLGKYEVLCRLSTGGMAEIFLASQRGLAGFRKLVVLKQILPDIKGQEEFVRMFLDEARVTAAFNHPNIAQVYDLDVADGELFLAMEFVQGATLVEVAKGCRAANMPIPIGLSLASARDTALALHYAHTFTDPLGRPASVIHRDVAEKNIMVTYEGVTKLLDFGIAKNLARKSRTQIGMVKGTSGYMSPEQILGEQLDARSDLFSLGVVLHECLTGLRLFHGKTPADGAGAVLHGQVPPPSRTNKAVPPELDAIVLKALSRKRDDRYASTLEFARALERAVGPLVWHPEQNAELIRRLFADRLAQTRKLLLAGQALSGDATGEVRVSQIFALSSVHPPPGQADEQEEDTQEAGTQRSLPTITPALASNSRPPASPTVTAPPVAKPPPPPPPPAPEPQKPPTPPRGAPAPRRPTSSALPAVAPPASPESVSLRRPVFEPLPHQKRASAPPPPPSESVMPPPPPREDTGNTQPNGPEAPRSDGRGRTLSRETRVAPEERAEPRSRSIRMDMHTMGTIPHEEGPPGIQGAASQDEESTLQEAMSARPARPSQARPRSMSSDRVSKPGASPPSRAQPRRAPTPTVEVEEDSTSELVTHQIRAYKPLEEEPPDTNETRIPDSEEGSGVATAPGGMAALPKRRGGGLIIALVLVALLLVGGGVAVALGLDGGRVSGLWAPASTQGVPPAQPVKPPTPTGGTVPQVPAPAPTPPAPTPPGPETTATPAPTPAAPAEPGKPTPASPTGTEGVALEAPPPENPVPTEKPEPAKDPEPELVTALSLKEEPPPPTKKPKVVLPKRPRKDQKLSEVDNPPSDWAPIEPKAEPKAEPTATQAPAAETGQLTLVTDPYAKVYLGKRWLGDTPLFKINMPAGKHSLRLVGPEGQNLRLPVEIKSSETTAVRITLDSLTRE